jgi:hypothetical protein
MWRASLRCHERSLGVGLTQVKGSSRAHCQEPRMVKRNPVVLVLAALMLLVFAYSFWINFAH